jgi:hypothetical protein
LDHAVIGTTLQIRAFDPPALANEYNTSRTGALRIPSKCLEAVAVPGG